MNSRKFQVQRPTSDGAAVALYPDVEPGTWDLGRSFFRFLIRLYQWTLSPWLGGSCRFYPSCSHYALEAVEQHGCLHGSWLSFKRVCKCHPLSRGGVDLVPAPVPARK
jgi:putative membrane protein insertion efficiency factor